MMAGMVLAAIVAGGAVYLLTRPAAPAAAAGAHSEERSVTQGPQPVPATAAAWAPPPMGTVPRPRPVASPVAAPVRAVVLNAISEQAGVPIAVVNDRVVREGDAFDGIRVLHIRATEVEVEVDGARRTLRF